MRRFLQKYDWLLVVTLTILLGVVGGWVRHSLFPPPTFAQGPSYNVVRDTGVVTDSYTTSLAGVTLDTQATPTTNAREVQVQMKAGTVVGTYTTCTAQAKTSYDGGTTYLTLGSAASVTLTTGTVNAWTLIEQSGTTSVTTSAVSSSAALGFGQLTKFTLACSGAYGTSAPIAVSLTGR